MTMSGVMNLLGLRRSRARAAALSAALVLVAVLGVAQATAATSLSRSKNAPSYYVLKSAKAKCKAHYSKQTVTLRVRRHQRWLHVHQVRCVYTGNGASLGLAPNFPTNLPTAAVSVTVLPGAKANSFEISAGQALNVGGAGVLADDTGRGLSAVLVSTTAHGTLTLNRDGTFGYIPSIGFSGVDSFVYKAEDSSADSSTPATVTINVHPVALSVGPYSVASAGTVSIPAPGVLAGDTGSGLSASLVSGASGGALTLNPDGSFSYTASPGFSGADSFSFQAVDASDLSSNTVTVTINVGAGPPVVAAQNFYGAIGNTKLQVGGTGGGGPEVHQTGGSLLAGDSDPNAGSLSVTAGTITTAHGGSVTLAPDGTFSYQPPTPFTGFSDSFSYQVDTSEGTSAPASATIHFTGTRVWYVNNAAPAGGNGSSAAPFKTLAPVTSGGSAGAGSGDVIFLYSGSVPYGGGVQLAANETLTGQPDGLTVDSTTLLGGSGTKPVITNTGGAGVTLADGDKLGGVDVANTSGAGISASGAFTIGADVSITNAVGDGLDVTGGASGSSVVGAQISGSAGHSVSIQNLTGGTVTLTGTIQDHGTGVLLASNTGAAITFTGTLTADTAGHPAFTAIGGGTVTVTGVTDSLTTTTATALVVNATTIGSLGLNFLSISAGTGSPSDPTDGVLISGGGSGGGGLSVTGTAGAAGSGGTIDHTNGALSDAGVSVTDSGRVLLENMAISGTGDGIYLSSDAPGALDEVSSTTIDQTGPAGTGIFAQTTGAGTIDLTLLGNNVTMGATSTQNGVTVSSGGDGGAGNVCLNTTQNAIQQSGSGRGMAVKQGTSSGFAIWGLPPVPADLPAVESFLAGELLAPATVVATQAGSTGFVPALAACPLPHAYGTS